MPRKQTTVGNLALAGYEDIFNVGAGNVTGERVVPIPLPELYPPEFHPFQINEYVCYRGCGCVPSITLGGTSVCGTNDM